MTDNIVEAQMDKYNKIRLETIEAHTLIETHITNLVKSRTIVLTGDTDHLSIDHIISRQFSKIDNPKDWDFQKDDVHEQNFLQTLLRMVPVWSYLLGREDLTKEFLEKVIAGDETLKLDNHHMDTHHCYDCQADLFLSIKGNHIHIDASHKCEHNRVFEVEIDFPTGEIVFGDWPAHFSEAKSEGLFDAEGKNFEINYLKGQRQTTDCYSHQQIFHHSVGNTCPALFYNHMTQAISIGGGTYDEETDENVPPKGYQDLGYFCTDLWWATMIDKKYYDLLMSKLSKDKKDDSEIEVTSIIPGRYRFTCYGRQDDDQGVYATAVRISDCRDEDPVFDAMAGKVLLTAEQAVLVQAIKYPLLYSGELDRIRFQVLDSVFNSLGNVRNKGDFLDQFAVPKDFKIPTEIVVTEGKRDVKEEYWKINPYPNFRKEHSLIYRMPLDVLDKSWIEAGIWFYAKCKEYFENGAEGYHGEYPLTKKDEEVSWIKAIDGYKKDGMTDAEWFGAVSKAYEIEYRGDLDDFLKRKWEKEVKRIIGFVDESIDVLMQVLSNMSNGKRTPTSRLAGIFNT